ncbi:unnamed protein product [Cladocopium goreaui]|uniref:Uncharacterized protein n=1 Tax=Cladocopium goreaui TaxID=2562237 RepID=A0A9P1DC15_9DINO|nr:unnamed protein product [Cladocopium goreaui]
MANDLSEDQVLAYLSKLSPEAAAALLSKANQEKNSSQLRNEDSEERPEDGENVAAFVMRTLAAGNIAGAKRFWRQADLSFLGEDGWSCLHWVVHAAGAALSKAKEQEPQVGCGCHCHSGASSARCPALALLREMLDHDDVAVDVRSSQGATSLMFAADAGDEEVCALLLHAGADPSATDADGDDAVAWAKARGHELSCLGRAAGTMDVALHIQQFLSCHGAYATGALGDQKIPARHAKKQVGSDNVVASVGCIYVVEAVEGRERHASLNRKDTTAEDVEAIVVPAALANSVAFPVMQLCKERGPAKPEENKIETATVSTCLPGGPLGLQEQPEGGPLFRDGGCTWSRKASRAQVLSSEQELRLNKTINRHTFARRTKDRCQSGDFVTSHRSPQQRGFAPVMKAIERSRSLLVMWDEHKDQKRKHNPVGFRHNVPALWLGLARRFLGTIWTVRDDALFSILAELAGPRLHELKPYEVTNLVWAFAKLSVRSAALFQSVAQMLQCRRRGEYKAQCLAAAAWSFAKSSAIPRSTQNQLFKSIGDEILPQVNSLKPQEVANVVWSFGQMKIKHQRLCEEIANFLSTPSGFSRFSTTQLTNILTAFAQVHFRHSGSISKICGVILRNSHSLTPEESSSLLWSLAELNVHDRTLLVQKILDMAAADITCFKYEELVVLNTAAKKLSPYHQSFFDVCEAALGTLDG